MPSLAPAVNPSSSRKNPRKPPGTWCVECGWKPKRGQLWPTHGPVACRWIEMYLIFAEGDFFGRPFVLREDQKLFLYRWYEYCGRCDRWRHRRGIRSASKGDGKTELIAAIACLEFAGPAPIAPAEPRTPEVIIAAKALKQAGKLFNAAGNMLGGRDCGVTQAPLCGLFEVYQTEIHFADGRAGKIQRAAAAAGSIDGGNATLFIADEVHEWGNLGSPNAEVHKVVSQSLEKRVISPGRELNLSTAGLEIDQSLFGTMIKHSRDVVRDPRIDPELLVDVQEAPDGLDYNNPADREIAVRAASAGAGVTFNVQDRVRRWNRPDVQHHDWIRYFANRWVDIGSIDSWLMDAPAGAWEACHGAWRSSDEHPFVYTVDMALKHDSVAVNRVEAVAGGRFAVTSKIWEAKDSGGRIDHLEVFEYCLEHAHGSGFRGVVYDPRFFEVPARILEERGVLAVQFDQQPQYMAPACGLTYELIVGRKIVHNGDPQLADHVKSAVKRPGERGFTLSKGKSRRHIDACIAMVMGVWVLHAAPDNSPPATPQFLGWDQLKELAGAGIATPS